MWPICRSQLATCVVCDPPVTSGEGLLQHSELSIDCIHDLNTPRLRNGLLDISFF